jgi:GAF domain-containing protein
MAIRANMVAQCSSRLGGRSRRWFNGRVGPGGEYLEVLQRLEAAEETDVVEQALVAARERLGMDAAYVGTIDAREQAILAVVGDPHTEELRSGAVVPLEETFCMRMLEGRIPNVIRDTRAEPAVRDLHASQLFGAYVGVPVTLRDGEVHGTLCCVSNDSRPELGPDELRFMRVLAEMIAVRIDRAQTDLARMTERFRAPQSPA